jgi:hypothetical protein
MADKELRAGENVTFEIFKFTINANTSVAMGSIVIKDAQLNPRTLQPFERLILDSVSANYSGSGPSADDVHITLYADLNNNNVVDADEALISFEAGEAVHIPGEGIAVPTGITPKAFGYNLDPNTAAVVLVTGSARVTLGTTQGARPDWKEALTPGVYPATPSGIES